MVSPCTIAFDRREPGVDRISTARGNRGSTGSRPPGTWGRPSLDRREPGVDRVSTAGNRGSTGSRPQGTGVRASTGSRPPGTGPRPTGSRSPGTGARWDLDRREPVLDRGSTAGDRVPRPGLCIPRPNLGDVSPPPPLCQGRGAQLRPLRAGERSLPLGGLVWFAPHHPFVTMNGSRRHVEKSATCREVDNMSYVDIVSPSKCKSRYRVDKHCDH